MLVPQFCVFRFGSTRGVEFPARIGLSADIKAQTVAMEFVVRTLCGRYGHLPLAIMITIIMAVMMQRTTTRRLAMMLMMTMMMVVVLSVVANDSSNVGNAANRSKRIDQPKLHLAFSDHPHKTPQNRIEKC